ncbi:Short-chain dehydrogenase TIC 32 B, chloroplastic [Asimina triloba]
MAKKISKAEIVQAGKFTVFSSIKFGAAAVSLTGELRRIQRAIGYLGGCLTAPFRGRGRGPHQHSIGRRLPTATYLLTTSQLVSAWDCGVVLGVMGLLSLVTGKPGPSGFGSASTAEQVTEGIDASSLTAIVTGGASGIGTETVRVLALHGAHVIIAARNLEAANDAKQLILEDNPAARIDILKLDLSSLKSVRAFADAFIEMDLPLNLLINNAGVMFCPYQLSADGIEMQFATNYLGHFLLTNLLLEKMKHTARDSGIEGRIVNLSSIAHIHTYEEGIRFDRLNDESGYSDKKAYGQSKLANILHSNELARHLKGTKPSIWSIIMKMDEVTAKKSLDSLLSAGDLGVLKVLTYMFWKNVPQGAATTCYVALHPSLKGQTGKYFIDCNEFDASLLARDEGLAKKLWDFSTKLIDSAQQR